MKILVVAPAWVGDTVMAQSLVGELRKRSPDAVIHLMAPPWTAPLGKRMDGVSAVHEFAFEHGRLELGKRIRAGRTLRDEAFDLAIVLPNTWKSGIAPFVAGIPERRGYLGETRHLLLNDIRTSKAPRTVDRYAALAGEPGEDFVAERPPVLRIDQGSARRLAEQLGLETGRPVIVLCPGAEYGPSKQWPAEHFAELVGLLDGEGLTSWILGSKNDRDIAGEIIRLAPPTESKPANLCGMTTLLEAVDLMGLASGVVSNDSGLMHVAAAIGRPVVALFGSTTPVHTPPLAVKTRIVERSLPCRPCLKRRCPLHHHDCLRTIQAHEVATALREILQP
jgi:heptosyltransferase-2